MYMTAQLTGQSLLFEAPVEPGALSVAPAPILAPRARFVNAEDHQRRSIAYGEWVERDDGHWVLRIPSC